MLPHPSTALWWGVAPARLSIPLPELLVTPAQSSGMACLAAAIRCMGLGPAQAHEILKRLHPALINPTEGAIMDPESAMFTSTPGLDIRSHQQASLYSSLFQS